jgi:hypothetical protein
MTGAAAGGFAGLKSTSLVHWLRRRYNVRALVMITEPTGSNIDINRAECMAETQSTIHPYCCDMAFNYFTEIDNPGGSA